MAVCRKPRLADRLADRFGPGQIFMDVDTIEPGVDFAAAITRAVSTCVVLIAVIGPKWTTLTNARGQPRIADPDDVVALEIKAALDRGIRVIPVLVDGASMPASDELPEALQGLARRHAIQLDHESFAPTQAAYSPSWKRSSTPGSPAWFCQNSTIFSVALKCVATGPLPTVAGVGQLWPPPTTVTYSNAWAPPWNS